jgi:raffinose/stachyose/melibiose transport system substrate-binding protein
MKKKAFFVSCMAIALIALASPGYCQGGPGEKIVLSFLHKWPEPERLPYFESVVKDFERAHPNIKIDMEAVSDEAMKDKLRVIMGGTVPDIFFSWSGEFAHKFVRAGAALDLSKYYAADPAWKKSFYPSMMKSSTFDGKLYGVPIRFSAKFMIYNTEKFAKLGIKEPKTWEEFMTACEKLKAAGETPILLGNQQPWTACHYLTTLNQKMVSDEIRIRDYSPTSGEFSDPGYVKALEYLQTIQTKGYFNNNVNSSSMDMTRQLFYAGRGAMIYEELPNFKRYEANIPGKWGFFKFPDIAAGKGNQSFITGAPDLFLVSSKSKHPKEAMEFLKFLTNRNNAEKLVKQLGFPSPVIGATNKNTALPQVIAAMAIVEKAQGMAEWLDTDMEAKVVDRYLGNLQLLFEGKAPADIMKEVREVAQQVKSDLQ